MTHKMAKSSAVLEAEKIILETRRQAENLIADIRNKQADSQSIRDTKKQIEHSLSELQSEKDPDALENIGISKADAVVDAAIFIPSLNIVGKIVHPPDKHEKVRVIANGVTLSLNLSELLKDQYS